jgi:hypothetical protein
VTWPLPELDVGVDDGELRPDDELLDLDELDLLLLDELELADPEFVEPELVELEPELLELPVSDFVWCVAESEVCEAADAAPGRLTATTPAAARLAAAADTVATRSRLRPRARSAMPDPSAIPGEAFLGGMLCLLMRMSLAAPFPMAL